MDKKKLYLKLCAEANEILITCGQHATCLECENLTGCCLRCPYISNKGCTTNSLSCRLHICGKDFYPFMEKLKKINKLERWKEMEKIMRIRNWNDLRKAYDNYFLGVNEGSNCNGAWGKHNGDKLKKLT